MDQDMRSPLLVAVLQMDHGCATPASTGAASPGGMQKDLGGRAYPRSIQVHGLDKKSAGDNKEDSAESGAETTHEEP